MWICCTFVPIGSVGSVNKHPRIARDCSNVFWILWASVYNLLPVLASTVKWLQRDCVLVPFKLRPSCSWENGHSCSSRWTRGGFAPVFYSSKQSAALSACQKFPCQSVITFPSGGPPAEGKPCWGSPTDSPTYRFIHPSFTGAVHVVAVMINISSTWQRVQQTVNNRLMVQFFPSCMASLLDTFTLYIPG